MPGTKRDPESTASAGSSAPYSYGTLLRRLAGVTPTALPELNVVQTGDALADGRIRLLRPLGRGGAGLVYEAFDEQRHEHIAVKMLIWMDPAGIYQLKNEFRSLVGIQHPNLAKLHELICHDDCWFITMECVNGVPFDAWARPLGFVDEGRLGNALCQLVEAIDVLHAHGKLHRDLKPSNVLVTSDARVVVLDFGLACDSQTRVGQTVTGEILGTPAYMAPELEDGAVADSASDAYAVGVMLYQSLTGALPFRGTPSHMLSTKRLGLRSWPRELSVSGAFKVLCEALLQPDPRHRPTLQEVASRVRSKGDRAPAGQPTRPSIKTDLVGRESELSVLWTVHGDCLAARPSLVAIRGAGGIGKTALCECFLDAVEATTEAVVLRARCYEHESVPFKALDPLVDELARHLRRLPTRDAGSVLPRNVFALTRLFPTLLRIDQIAEMPDRPVREPHELRRLAISALLEWLARLRDRYPIVIFIDDLQWACADSLQALSQLLVERASPPIMIVVAFRDGARDAVQSMLQTACDNPGWSVHDLSLTALSNRDAEQLAAQLLGAETSHVSAVWRDSGGNPLLLQELARFALQGGALAREVSLASVVESQLASVTPQARDLAQMVALIGEPVRFDLALQICGACTGDLERLCDMRLLRTGAGVGRALVECYHDRIREELVTRVDETRARTQFAELASIIAAQDPIDHGLASRCFQRAGDDLSAARHAALAARDAERLMAFEQAAELYATAIRLGGHNETTLLSLEVALGTALENSGQSLRAAETFLRAAAMTTGLAATDLRRRAAEQMLITGQVDAGVRELKAMCRALDIDLSLPWPQIVYRSLKLLYADTRRRDGVELRLSGARTAVMSLLGYAPRDAARVSEDYLKMSLQADATEHRIRALGFQAYILGQRDPHSTQVASLLRQMNELAHCHAAPELLGFAEMILGAQALFAGRREARRSFERARALFRDSIGVHWERDAVNTMDQQSAFHAGDYADIARDTPGLIQEAERRGRFYQAAMLTGFAGVVAFIVPDDVDACRRKLLAAELNWPAPNDRGWPSFALLLGHAMLHLYAGEPFAGLDLLRGQRNRFETTLLSNQGGGLRSYIAYFRSCAASALASSRTRRTCGERWDAAELRGILAGASSSGRRGTSALSHAALAIDAGKPQEAVAWLRQANESLERAGSRLQAAAVNRRLGQLNAHHGADLIEQAEMLMKQQGIRNIEAMTEFLCPGCRA